MRSNAPFARGTYLLIALAVMLGATSCGTILYPERRGQAAGRVDVGVAVLDGIGLLFFFVPGVIAFAVDFTTGAIYLPRGSSRLDLNPSDFRDARIIQTQTRPLTRHDIEAVVERETGQEINLASSGIQVAGVQPGRDLAWGRIGEVLTPNQFAAFENNRLERYREPADRFTKSQP